VMLRREAAPASAVKLGGERGLRGLAGKESQVTTGVWVSLWPMPVSGGKVLTRPYVDSHRGYVFGRVLCIEFQLWPPLSITFRSASAFESESL